MQKTLLALISCAFALLTFASCDELNGVLEGDEFTQCMGIDTVSDVLNGLISASQDEVMCPNFQTRYQEAIAKEGELLSDEELTNMVNQNGDFAMSISLNATGIKKLFENSVSWADSFPVVIDVGGCRKYNDQSENCLAFGFTISGYDIIFGVPIESKLEPELNKTSIMANLEKAQIINLTGSSIADYTIESAVKLAFNGYLKRYSIFEIAAWNIGNNDIKLYAGAPKVHIDDESGYKALEFGMYSNLAYTQDAINIARDMPHDAEIGLHIHPDLIRAIIARMMTEKDASSDDSYITRDVSLASSTSTSSTTSSSPTGFHVSMTDFSLYPQERLYACSSDWRDFFTLGFRLWSTESFCGYMDIVAGMKISISDSKFTIGVGNIHGGQSEGALSLTNGILNAITTSDFFKQVLDYTTISLNFNEMEVSDDNGTGDKMRKVTMDSDTFVLNLDGSGISLYLNFLDL